MSKEKGKITIEDVVSYLQKEYGTAAVKVAADARAIRSWKRIESGIFAVDYVAGGGIPHGAITLISGVESGGKSFISTMLAIGAQRTCRDHVVKMIPTEKTVGRCLRCGYRGKPGEETCPNKTCEKKKLEGTLPEIVCPECKKYLPGKVLITDPEHNFETTWAVRLGLDTTLVHLHQPESAEEAFDGATMLLQTGEFDLFILDSIAQLTPMKEIEKSAEEWQQGLLARLVNKFLRTLVSQMNAPGMDKLRRVTSVLVNQVREKIGIFFGDNTTLPGGKGQLYAATFHLRVWPGKVVQDKDGNTLAVVLRTEVIKNKSAPTREMESSFRLWIRDVEVDEVVRRAGDTEEDEVLLDYALKFALIPYEDGRYTVGGKAFGSKAQVMDYIKGNREVRERIRQSLMGMMLGEVWYDLKELEKKKAAKANRAAQK